MAHCTTATSSSVILVFFATIGLDDMHGLAVGDFVSGLSLG